MAGGRLQGVDVRSAAPSDAADIASLLGEVGQVVTARTIVTRLERMSRDSAILVATGFAPVIGVVALHWSRGVTSDAARAWVDVLAVGGQDRGRGIGRLLLKSASQLARTAGCDTLEIVAEDGGVGFLVATGFARSGQVLCRPLRRRSGAAPE